MNQKDQHPDEGSLEEISILDQISLDMSNSLFERRFGSIIPWKEEVSRLLETLQKRSNHNVLLLGPTGVGKRTMVLRLAEQIAAGRVPPRLRNKKILEISLPSVLPLIQDTDEFEKVLFLAVKEAVDREDVILYFNQLNNFLGSADGSLYDASYIIEASTRQPELQVIASMSDWAHRKLLNEHQWLRYNLATVAVNEPSPEMAKKILRVVRAKLESFHQLEIAEQAVDKAIDLSNYYLKTRVLPGKALEILDEACATEVVRAMRDRKKRIQPINAEAVEITVSKKLGIPVKKLHDRTGSELLSLEENLKSRIKGQDAAIHQVANVVRVAKLGLSSHSYRPDGVFLFVGPNGVGKTELARSLSIELFGSEEHLIRLDMSQFSDDDAAMKLLGGRGMIGPVKGVLPRLLEKRPNAVFVIAGVEKASPKVGPILLQILNEGQTMDDEGRILSFASTTLVVVANSDNIMADEPERPVGFTESTEKKKISNQRKSLETATKSFFGPDFLASFDEIVFFDPLTPAAVQEIAGLAVGKIQERLALRDIKLEISKEVMELVASEGSSQSTGARQLAHTVESLLLQPVSKYLLHRKNARKIRLVLNRKKIEVVSARKAR